MNIKLRYSGFRRNNAEGVLQLPLESDIFLKKTKIASRTEVRQEDREAVGRLVAETGFFFTAEIAIAKELVEERLEQGGGGCFLFAEEGNRLTGYAWLPESFLCAKEHLFVQLEHNQQCLDLHIGKRKVRR